MSDETRTDALRNPSTTVGDNEGIPSRTQFGNTSIFDGKMMLHMLGTWWRRWFGDAAQLSALYDGTGLAEYETYLTFLDAIACLSRFDVPIFHTRNWGYLTLLESEMQTTSQILYGTEGLVYTNRDVPSYGFSGTIDGYKFTAPDDLAAIPSMMNRIIDPSLVLLNERDYTLTNGSITFNDNPFENTLIPKREILDAAGEVVDHQIAMWMHLSEWDLEYVYRHFGYVLNIWMESSEYYKGFINALWDNMVLGSSRKAFECAWEAMTGVRFAVGNEVVTFIETFSDRKHVITDKDIYTYSVNSEVLVQEGDELYPGQSIVDTVQIAEPSHLTDWNVVVGVSLGADFLNGSNRSPIVFQNRDVPLEYLGVYPDGKVRLEFSVSGDPRDVTDFWHNVHINENVSGTSLAEMLDTRGNKTEIVPEWALAQTINPFQFAMDNILENNIYAVLVKQDGFINGSIGVSATAHLQRHLPPQTTFMVFICMDVVDELIELDTQASDSLSITALGVYNEDLYDNVVDHGPRIKTVPENCR